jgi:hypothetical protein
MPILGTIASGISGNLYAASYESIATTTLSTNTPTITFSSIPSTYTHLQLRVWARTTRSGGPDILGLRMNNSLANDYADHIVFGDGSTVNTDLNINYPQINVQRLASSNSGADIFSGLIIEILDYKNTNKFKTVRYFGGFDAGAAVNGRIGYGSGQWRSTNAITELNIFSLFSENYTPYSNFALYGIKGV